MSFSKSFCSKTPFKNVEKPAKPKISDAERTGISDKEHHAISSNTDAHSVMIVVDKDGKRVEPKDAATKMSPLEQGGYVGGSDVAGAYYVPTGQMYADMFAKIGQAVADIDANKQKKKDEKQKKDDAKNLSDNAYFEKYNEQRPKTVDYTNVFKTKTD